jgi:hypothetical protein
MHIGSRFRSTSGILAGHPMQLDVRGE